MSLDDSLLTSPENALRRALGTRYRLEREIGRGGAALVYLAHDVKHDRPVAVKILRPEVSASVGAERFLREIGTAARLQHPHIVPIYDSGDVESMLYLVMPFVDGESLRERLDRDVRLPLAEALRLTSEVAEALSFAHSRGIVHRDVKPENVLLYQGHALVADFGIAMRIASDDVPPDESGERLGLVFNGTPVYMAPEQSFGDAPVDARADIYALGSMLYELLTGRPPYDGPSAMAILASKMARAALPPQQMLQPLPPFAEEALMRSLERDRDRRFASIAEFAAALNASRSAVAATRGASVAALSSIAVLPFANRSGDAADDFLGDGISEDLISALAKLPGLRVVGRASAFAFRDRTENLKEIGAELGVTTVLTGGVRRVGERMRIAAELTDVDSGYALWSERFDRGVTDVFAVQDEISRAIADALRVQLLSGTQRLVDTPTMSFSAYESYLKGRFEWSQRTAASMRRALQHLQSAVDADPTFTLALAGLADCYVTMAIYDVLAPAQAMPKALDAVTEALRHRPQSPEALTARGSIRALYRFDWTGAEDDYLAALSANEQGPVTHQWYAMHLLAPRARFTEARAQVARARELDPLSPAIAASGGILRLYEGDAEQAVRELALVIAQHPSFGLAPLFEGLAFSALQRHDDAVAVLQRAVILSGHSAEARSALAYALARGGHEATAREILAALHREAMSEYVSAVSLAQVYVGLGEPSAALDQLERALADRATALPLLGVRPSFAPLRAEPRFHRILAALES